MVEATSTKKAGTLEEEFLKLEKRVVGYEDFVDCNEQHFNETLEGLNDLVERIQNESVFSSNEALSDIHTEHLKLLMIPFYQADVLMRLMTNRDESVKKGHTYYLEYLKLMNHYNLLDKGQITLWKTIYKEHADRTRPMDTTDDKDDVKRQAAAFQKQHEDREAKIAAYKLKK